MFTIQISGTILDSATTLDGAIAIARREASGDTGVDIYREGKHVRRFYQPRVWGDR